MTACRCPQTGSSNVTCLSRWRSTQDEFLNGRLMEAPRCSSASAPGMSGLPQRLLRLVRRGSPRTGSAHRLSSPGQPTDNGLGDRLVLQRGLVAGAVLKDNPFQAGAGLVLLRASPAPLGRL